MYIPPNYTISWWNYVNGCISKRGLEIEEKVLVTQLLWMHNELFEGTLWRKPLDFMCLDSVHRGKQNALYTVQAQMIFSIACLVRGQQENWFQHRFPETLLKFCFQSLPRHWRVDTWTDVFWLFCPAGHTFSKVPGRGNCCSSVLDY